MLGKLAISWKLHKRELAIQVSVQPTDVLVYGHVVDVPGKSHPFRGRRPLQTNAYFITSLSDFGQWAMPILVSLLEETEIQVEVSDTSFI